MNKETIERLLREYIDAPEAWGDNVMIETDSEGRTARLYDEESGDTESSELDYWPVMELLKMSVDNPGEWEIDQEAIEELLGNYQ